MSAGTGTWVSYIHAMAFRSFSKFPKHLATVALSEGNTVQLRKICDSSDLLIVGDENNGGGTAWNLKVDEMFVDVHDLKERERERERRKGRREKESQYYNAHNLLG